MTDCLNELQDSLRVTIDEVRKHHKIYMEVSNLMQERIERLEAELNSLKAEQDTLRVIIRRVRLSKEINESKYRRDSTFVDSARRKMLQFWDGNPATFNDVPPAQLAFLLLLLDIPQVPQGFPQVTPNLT